jgi:hypothetical protein
MKHTHDTLHTKDEIRSILAAWQINGIDVPKKKEKVIIAWPKNPNNNFNMTSITWSNEKSTYGKRLYRLLMWNKPLDCPK